MKFMIAILALCVAATASATEVATISPVKKLGINEDTPNSSNSSYPLELGGESGAEAQVYLKFNFSSVVDHRHFVTSVELITVGTLWPAANIYGLNASFSESDTWNTATGSIITPAYGTLASAENKSTSLSTYASINPYGLFIDVIGSTTFTGSFDSVEARVYYRFIGDADLDGDFDVDDLIDVFAAGKYNNGPANWSQGDWDGDGDFDSDDLVEAFASGNYLAGAAALAEDIETYGD